MTWQDTVFAIANILTTLSLIPQIIFVQKQKKTSVLAFTAGLYALCLYAMSTAMFSLQLWLSATSLFITGVLWTVICIQSIVFRNKK